jgi:hypothetical protein
VKPLQKLWENQEKALGNPRKSFGKPCKSFVKPKKKLWETLVKALLNQIIMENTLKSNLDVHRHIRYMHVHRHIRPAEPSPSPELVETSSYDKVVMHI